jgi:hypothetical protein
MPASARGLGQPLPASGVHVLAAIRAKLRSQCSTSNRWGRRPRVRHVRPSTPFGLPAASPGARCAPRAGHNHSLRSGSRPHSKGTRLYPNRGSEPVVDACSGAACKFLQRSRARRPARSGKRTGLMNGLPRAGLLIVLFWRPRPFFDSEKPIRQTPPSTVVLRWHHAHPYTQCLPHRSA